MRHHAARSDHTQRNQVTATIRHEPDLVVVDAIGCKADRADKQAERIDEGTRELIGRLNAEVGRLAAECKDLREGLRACERKHLESDAEVMRLKSMLQGFGEARERASLIIAADKLEQKEKDGKA